MTLNGQSVSEMHRDGFQTVQVSLSKPVGVTNMCKPAEERIGLYFICSLTHLVRLLAPGSTGFIQSYLSVGMSKIKSLKPVTYRNQFPVSHTTNRSRPNKPHPFPSPWGSAVMALACSWDNSSQKILPKICCRE